MGYSLIKELSDWILVARVVLVLVHSVAPPLHFPTSERLSYHEESAYSPFWQRIVTDPCLFLLHVPHRQPGKLSIKTSNHSVNEKNSPLWPAYFPLW